MCVPGAFGGQKIVLDPLELELQMLGSYHVGAGTQTQVLCSSSKFLPLSHLARCLLSYILERVSHSTYWPGLSGSKLWDSESDCLHLCCLCWPCGHALPHPACTWVLAWVFMLSREALNSFSCLPNPSWLLKKAKNAWGAATKEGL